MTFLQILNFLIGLFCLYVAADIFEKHPYRALFGCFLAGMNFYWAFA